MASTQVGLFTGGVAAVVDVVDGWAPDRWAEPACGEWTGTDLAGHLLAVIGWYDEWLDRAERGDPSPPFPADQLAERNAAALAALPPADGPGRIAAFASEARRYAARVGGVLDLPFGYPRGTVTAGLHAGLAAFEWHAHAWDLSGGRHLPDDPLGLYLAAVECRHVAANGLDQPRVAPEPPPLGRDPWLVLLEASGRLP